MPYMKYPKTRALLACALAGLTSLPQAASRPYGRYFEIMPQFWQQVYREGGSSLYCGRKFRPEQDRRFNIEHVYPMSWVMREEGCYKRERCRRSSQRFNRIEADMHNLYPALKELNQARGAMAYGGVAGEARRFGSCDFEIDERTRRVEPPPFSRGNIARALFYMHERYDLPLFRRQAELMKQWNRLDPPDEAERLRNDRIEKLQGNRNRFIDHPEAVNNLSFR